MWITSKDFAILASTRLAFVSVNNKVTRSRGYEMRKVIWKDFSTAQESGNQHHHVHKDSKKDENR